MYIYNSFTDLSVVWWEDTNIISHERSKLKFQALVLSDSFLFLFLKEWIRASNLSIIVKHITKYAHLCGISKSWTCVFKCPMWININILTYWV